jgi:opacity protein-like surface antigen
MRRTLSFAILAVVLAAAVVVPAHAAGLTGAGLQIGWATSPDDFLAGFHYNARPMGEELSLVPSLDFGFGDVTMISPNLDAHYTLKTSSKLQPYLGAGVAVPWYDYDGGSEWKFGGAVLGGVHVSPNMSFEAKYGLGDAPEWKFVFLLHK